MKAKTYNLLHSLMPRKKFIGTAVTEIIEHTKFQDSLATAEIDIFIKGIQKKIKSILKIL